MYYLCEKYYKPIRVQYYIADCVSWVSSLTLLDLQINWTYGGFPGGAVIKNPPANAGDTGSSPGLGRSHMPRSD